MLDTLVVLSDEDFNAPKGIRLFYTRVSPTRYTRYWHRWDFNAPKGIRLFYTLVLLVATMVVALCLLFQCPEGH